MYIDKTVKQYGSGAELCDQCTAFQVFTGDFSLEFKFVGPYLNRTRVAAVKEKRFTGIQRKPAAWIAP
jgi:hypothetical protein